MTLQNLSNEDIITLYESFKKQKKTAIKASIVIIALFFISTYIITGTAIMAGFITCCVSLLYAMSYMDYFVNDNYATEIQKLYKSI